MAFPVVFRRADGETVAKADFDDYDAQLASALKEAGSSQTPAQTTTEVRAARGNMASLTARIDGVIDANGQPVNLITSDMLAQAWNQQLALNDLYHLWPSGDTSAPHGFTLSGAGAAVARTGSGLGDTTAPELGLWCVKLTSGAGAAAQLAQQVIPAALAARFAGFSKYIDANGNVPKVTIVGRVKCATSTGARVYLSNGLTTYNSNQAGGAGNVWETVYAQAPLTDGFTKLEWGMVSVAGTVTAYFAPISVYISPVTTPRLFVMGDWRRSSGHVLHLPGAQTASAVARKGSYSPRRPHLVTDVKLHIETAPTGQALKVDLQSWGGAAFESLFTTLPEIAAGAFGGGAQPDGTYARRCIVPGFNADLSARTIVREMVTQVGSGAAGSDLTINVGWLEQVHPFEGLYDYNTLGT